MPISTLFPYTSSSDLRDATESSGVPRDSHAGLLPGFGFGGDQLPVRIARGKIARESPDIGHVADLVGIADRKSTRLNSSHGYISYAVFCLKKKIKHLH